MYNLFVPLDWRERERPVVSRAPAPGSRRHSYDRGQRSTRPRRTGISQLVHFYAERGSPKFEKPARRWLVRYLSEGTPSLRDVAKVTASLADASSRRAG